jgi:hypothetical protein
VEETGVPGETHWPTASNWQTLSHNVESSTLCHERDSNSQLQWWQAKYRILRTIGRYFFPQHAWKQRFCVPGKQLRHQSWCSKSFINKGVSWPWSDGSWICNQSQSPLMFSLRARCTTLCDKVCQWLATGQWFSPGPPVSSTNKTDRHDIKLLGVGCLLEEITGFR